MLQITMHYQPWKLARMWPPVALLCLLMGCQARPQGDEAIPVADASGGPIAATSSSDAGTPPVEVVGTKEIAESFASGSIKRRFQVNVLADGQEVRNGAFTEFYENGQKFRVGRFQNGESVGEWKYYHDNGVTAKTVAYDGEGRPHGEWTVYRTDGTKRRTECYAHGQRDGTWTVFTPDGEQAIKQMSYQNSLLHGTMTEWFPGGQKAMESTYVEGKLHGIRQRWYEDGGPLTVENFQHGKQHGTSTSWNSSGAVVANVEFRNGLRASSNTAAQSAD